MKNGSALQWLGFREKPEAKGSKMQDSEGRGLWKYGTFGGRTTLIGFGGKGQIMRT